MQNNYRKGQSLLETILALSVLTVGFMGIASLLAQSFFLNRTVASEITATYLAEEGIELARSVIYHDVFGTPRSGWGYCFGVPVNNSKNFQIDFTTLADPSQVCTTLHNSTYANEYLYYDPVTHLYGYQNNLPVGDNPTRTGFTRAVNIIMTSANEITVESTVDWSAASIAAGSGRTVYLVDHFYNWYP